MDHLSPTTCYRPGCSPCHRSLHYPRVATTTQQRVGISHPPQTWPSPATFFLTSTNCGQPGRRMLRRLHRLRLRGDFCVPLPATGRAEPHVELLYRLGSEGVQKFHASRLLRSHQTGNQYLYFLQRLLNSVNEPFQTRARQQLYLVLKFRKLTPAPAPRPLRLPQLAHDFGRLTKQWLSTFIQQNRHNFPPFLQPTPSIVEIHNPRLGSLVYNYKHWIAQWQPVEAPLALCACADLPLPLPHSIPHHSHVLGQASTLQPTCSLWKAHMGGPGPPNTISASILSRTEKRG